MLVEARDVEDWSKRAHILIDALTDSNPKKSVALPVTLGNGSFQLSVTVPFWRDKRLQMLWRGCGSVNSNTNPSIEEVTSLLALLDSAAAMAGGGVGRPPTLFAPLLLSEVSCPASADEANARPLAPASMATLATEIGVEMVVDTTGLVERSSIRVMRGTNPALADSIRATVARWRFHAAEIDGTPVRQFVQTAVAIGPRLVPSDGGRIKLEATNDGWVHFRRGDATTHSVVQEWYDPDTVDAFAARMNALNREADTLRKDTNLVVQKSTSLGTPPAMVLTDGFSRHGKMLERPVSWVGCSGSISGAGTTAFIDELVEMAKQARQRRTPPGDPSVGPFMWNEVTCPATLKWTQADRFGIRNVSAFPRRSLPHVDARHERPRRGSCFVRRGHDGRGGAELDRSDAGRRPARGCPAAGDPLRLSIPPRDPRRSQGSSARDSGGSIRAAAGLRVGPRESRVPP